MTSPPDDNTAVITALRAERDAALSEKAALAEALARRDSEYAERIEHQAATIDVLKAMSASPGDPQPVFDLIVRQAQAQCNSASAALYEFDGMIHCRSFASGVLSSDAIEAYFRQFPMPLKHPSNHGLTASIRDQRIVHIRDASAAEVISTISRDQGVQSAIVVPLITPNGAAGCIALSELRTGGYSDAQIALLQTFAEQAVIAIRSAETYRALRARTTDLQESLEYQTAISDVLKVISRSTFDLQPVLETVLLKAARLCDAEFGVISTREDDAFRVGSVYSNSPEYHAIVGGRLVPAERGTVIGRTAVEGRIVHILDIGADPDYAIPQILETGGARTCLGVPLLREGAVVGVISLARPRVEAFTEQQIELVSTFADQAVIAIENTRLITEQREALEQQTATAEVLQVINASPGNLGPVFDTMLEKALHLCDAAFGILFTYDGELFRAAAYRGGPVGFSQDAASIVPEPGSALDRVAKGDRVVQILDVVDTDAYRKRIPSRVYAVERLGARTVLWVGLHKDNAVVGVFAIYREEVRSFSEKQIALLQSFAAQAVIAIENAPLLTEQREALEQQTATAEVLQVINSSPGNLGPVFKAILEKAHSLCGATKGAFFITLDGERFHVAATRGLSDAYTTILQKQSPTGQGRI